MIETRWDTLVELAKRLQAAERKSLKCAERRAALSPGGTRARVTTANADWARAAEHRDRCEKAVAEEVARLRLLGEVDR